MSKIIKKDIEARDNIISGIDAVADIVKTTVGPRGRNILIRDQLNIPVITNDGVTIAKSIQLKDNVEDAGAALIISAANKTNEVAGDGTTTTTILAQEMIHKYIELCTENVNSVQVQKEMIQASEAVDAFLKTEAIPVKDNSAIKRVATISSGDEVIGDLISLAFENAGDYGSVIVETSKTGVDRLSNIQGMKLSIGSVNPYLLSDRINLKSEMIDCNVLVTKDKIDNVSDILPLLDHCVKSGLKLLIICDDIEFEPLNMILMNKAKGAPLNVSIIRLPGFGELREQLVEDICIATGATLMGRDQGLAIKEFLPSYLGEAEEVIISMDDTIIKFKDESSEGILLANQRFNRIEELKIQLEKNDSNAESYKRRISNLSDGISVLELGGNSEVEIKDKKLRVEDAINSVEAAKEEGVVPGGGYSFLNAYMNMSRNNTLGEEIVMESLLAVTRQIAENSGKNGTQVVKDCIDKKLGYNALTDSYENLVDTGVINSVKVDRYSLLNATSIASTVITMGGLIIEENEKDQNIFQLQGPNIPMIS